MGEEKTTSRTDYGPLRRGRFAVGLGCGLIAALRVMWFAEGSWGIVVAAGALVLGCVLRLYDCGWGVVFRRSWQVTPHSWGLDFAIRGYFRSLPGRLLIEPERTEEGLLPEEEDSFFRGCSSCFTVIACVFILFAILNAVSDCGG